MKKISCFIITLMLIFALTSCDLGEIVIRVEGNSIENLMGGGSSSDTKTEVPNETETEEETTAQTDASEETSEPEETTEPAEPTESVAVLQSSEEIRISLTLIYKVVLSHGAITVLVHILRLSDTRKITVGLGNICAGSVVPLPFFRRMPYSCILESPEGIERIAGLVTVHHVSALSFDDSLKRLLSYINHLL